MFSPECVNLFDHVEGVLAELDVVGRGPATLVLVSGNVGAEGLQVAQAVSGHHDLGSFPFNDLKIDKCLQSLLQCTGFGEFSPLQLILEPIVRGLLSFCAKKTCFGQIFDVGQFLFVVNDQILNMKKISISS